MTDNQNKTPGSRPTDRRDLAAKMMALADQMIEANHGIEQLLQALACCARDVGRDLAALDPDAGGLEIRRTLGQLAGGTGNLRPAEVLVDDEIQQVSEFLAWHDDLQAAEKIGLAHLAAIVKYVRILEVRLARQQTEAPEQ